MISAVKRRIKMLRYLPKMSLFVFLAATSSMPFTTAYADTCIGLGNQPVPSLYSGTSYYLHFATQSATNINVNVDLTNYGQMIGKALANQPIATVSFPACISINTSNDTTSAWTNTNISQPTIVYIEMIAPASSYDPAGQGSDTIALAGPAGYQLAADYSFCPCSQYNSASNSCSGTTARWAVNNTKGAIMVNTFSPAGLAAGVCTDALGSGGIIFNIYSQKDQIPYVGQYTASFSFGVAPDQTPT